MPLPPATPSRTLAAFTLLEGAIVTAIMGVLLIFLSSGFGLMRNKAADAKCVQNLRNLANAAFSFAAENRGRLPFRGDWAHPYTIEPSLAPYLHLPMRSYTEPVMEFNSVLTCPAAQRGKTRTQQEYHRTYSINQYATGGERGSDSIVETWKNHVESRESPKMLAQMERASQQAFFMDGTAVYEDAMYRYSSYQAPDRLTPVTGIPHEGWKTPYVHAGAINVIYMDGRVAPLKKEEALRDFVGPTNAAGSPRTKAFWGAKL